VRERDRREEVTSQAIRNATRPTEVLTDAIEHYCTTDHPKDVKLSILLEAESNIMRVKQTAAKGRYKLTELKVLAIHS
jgi:acyl CoA:acetate/3-ketoacid CoA transferase